MDWIEPALQRLEHPTGWGYAESSPPASEPVALAALALSAHRRQAPAEAALQWLAEQQAPDGSIGISQEESAPHWPTSLAVLAWCAGDRDRRENLQPGKSKPWRDCAELGVSWLLRIQGNTMPQVPEMGHDTMLVGWPWVEETHSWLEPSAYALLALKAAGHGDHPRAQEAVRLIYDRILPTGGCNYGNTVVFGQALRPQVAPSGLALLALADEADPKRRIDRTMTYVRGALGPDTTAATLAFGLLGLAAMKQLPKKHADWMSAAAARTRVRGAYGPRLTWLLLAALGQDCPLLTMTRRSAQT